MRILLNCIFSFVLILLTSPSFAQMGNQAKSRVIQLESALTEPINDVLLPQGTLRILKVNTAGDLGGEGEEIWLTVQALERVDGNQVYCLYISPRASVEEYDPLDDNYRILFNTSFNGTWQRFSRSEDLDVFDEPAVTVFVVLEEDDGLEFSEGGPELLVMKGTSILP